MTTDIKTNMRNTTLENPHSPFLSGTKSCCDGVPLEDKQVPLADLAAGSGSRDTSSASQDTAVIPVLFDNASLSSYISQTVVPIAPAPAGEPGTEELSSDLASALGIAAPPGLGATVEIVTQYLALSGQQNTAQVLPDLTLKVRERGVLSPRSL